MRNLLPRSWTRSVLQRRPLTVGGLAIIVAAAALIDAGVGRDEQAIRAHSLAAPSASAISSAWYCAVTPAIKADPAAGTVAIFNPTDEAITGVATFFVPGGAQADAPFGVPARSRVELRPGDLVDAAYVATLVHVDGGGVAVEHSVTAAGATSFAACSSNTSSSWYVSDGSTAATARQQLALFNPFADDAVADLDFVTSEGRAAPAEFSGIVVAARSVTVIDVGDHLRRRDWVASHVEARRGRLVVDQLQFGTWQNAAGVSLTGGAIAPSTSWFLPDGMSGGGMTDRLSLANPQDREAEVRVRVQPDNGASIEPFDLHVPANGRVAVALSEEDRVPKNVGYAVSVESLNGLRVVATRVADAVAPSALRGASTIVAAPEPWRHWALPVGKTSGADNETVWIFNPGTRPTTVRVAAMTNGSASPVGQPVRIEPGKRIGLSLDDPALTTVSDPSVDVVADEPVIVGRQVAFAASSSMAASIGVPLR